MFRHTTFAVTFVVLLLQVTSSNAQLEGPAPPHADIIDLVCETDFDCEMFKSAAVNSTCKEGQCWCIEVSSGNRIICKPTVVKVSNQVGGQCPCLSANSYCNEKTHLCACKEGFLPSREGKKCISKSVPLGKTCEIDEQCISHDHFSHCDDVLLNCTCSNHFVMYQNTCHSIIASGETPCQHDTDCTNRTANSTCFNKQCICGNGFVANAENTTCLAIAHFEQACIDSNQCIAQLGVGSVCNENKCVCNEMHFPFAVHSHNNATNENKVQVICKRKVTHGASCNEDQECYQFHRGPHEQTMECFMSECVCTNGFFEKEGICVSKSSASTVYVSHFAVLLLISSLFYAKQSSIN